MKLLLLSGHGINMHVDNARLHITNGRTSEEEPEKYVFSPKKIDYDHVVIYGSDGSLSIDAIRWLVKHNIQISILNWDGKLLTTMLPPEGCQVKYRLKQYERYNDMKTRIDVSRKLLLAKFARTKTVLGMLKQRYPGIRDDISEDLVNFEKAKTVRDLMVVEAHVASVFWRAVSKIVPEKYEFESRAYQKRPWGAGDIVNCMLNYGYALLEAECLRAINSAGLDPHIGFLHEMNSSKNSLAYDLQEPYRFMVDLAVLHLIETGAMDKKDFVRTENYNLRLRSSGAKKLLNEVNALLSKKVEYEKMMCSWNYIILVKARGLAQYLQGNVLDVDFSSPNLIIPRQDSEEVRQKIMGLSYSWWEKQGYSKGTLHHLKKQAIAEKPFTLNKHIRDRLETLTI